ncbi:MAG: autotransporter outer membrane beta-barrel domain-containing protein, partial [Rhizobiaceae bacterium]|nr:autotransporter outer membrane beta-barrel domain-containing protein [Rhizobiaceae bacterium]
LERSSTGAGDAIAVNYAVDTTPWSGPGAALVPDDVRLQVNANHDAFGAYVEHLLTGAAPGDFAAELGAYVLNRPDAGSLLGTYGNLISEETFAATDATRLSALRFADRLNSCGRRGEDGSIAFDEEGSCGWASVEGRYLERDGSSAGPAYDERLFGLSAGAQVKVGDGLFLGAALGWETSSLSFDSASGDVDRIQAGVVGKLELGATTIATSIGGGWYGTSLDRMVVTPGGVVTAQGDTDGGFLAAHARVDHRFEVGSIYLKPTADLGITYLSQGAYDETGAGGYGLSIGSLDATTVSFNPFLEVGGVFTIGGMKANASVRGGVLALFGDDPSVEASFVGLPVGPNFAIIDDDESLFADIGAAIDMAVSDRLTVKGSVDALLSGDEQSVGAALRLKLAF